MRTDTDWSGCRSHGLSNNRKPQPLKPLNPVLLLESQDDFVLHGLAPQRQQDQDTGFGRIVFRVVVEI